jgi:hypothetical protein
MTASRRNRLRLLLLAAAGGTALAVCVFFAWQGQWVQFGGFVASLAAIRKAPGRRWSYISHWVLPLSLSYGIVLCGSIFWGLRRLRKGAR